MASPLTAAARRENLEMRIRRFEKSTRKRFRKLAKTSSRLGELAFTFPAAAFVLVAGARTHQERGAAVGLVKAGRPLEEVACALRLPMWLRALPPEAFCEPLAEVPGGAEFTRHIANHLPKETANAAAWLRFVLYGAQTVGEDFAIWLASLRMYEKEDAGEVKAECLLPLAAFAWYSLSEGNIGRGLIAQPWRGQHSLAKTLDSARRWIEAIVFDYCRSREARRGQLNMEMKCRGYRLIPLTTPGELREEGERMSNCVANYAANVEAGTCVIFSVRRGGTRVATMEILPAGRGGDRPVIGELLAHANTPVSDDVRRAAESWLAKQGPYRALQQGHTTQLNAQRWERMWRPFCEGRPELAGFLADPVQGAARLRENLARLSRLAKA